MKNEEVDQDGWTAEERLFRVRTGARWHSEPKEGWYLPFDFGGLPMTENDRRLADKYPWGIYLGRDVKRATKKLATLD